MAVTNTKTGQRVRSSPIKKAAASPEPPLNIADAPSFGSNGEPAFNESLDDIKPEMAKSKADTELIIEALKQAYVLVGTVTIPFSQADGFIIVRNAEDMAESWRMLLDNDVKLRKRMKSLIQGSGWGTVITAHVPVVIAIMGNHKASFDHLVKRRTTTQTTAQSSAI
jgi:hypothetical protein